MSYIDKIKKGTDIYDVQDARIAPTAQDEGKVLAADSTGGLEFITADGGTKLYAHKIAVKSSGLTNPYLVFISKQSAKYPSANILFSSYINGVSQGHFLGVKLIYTYNDPSMGSNRTIVRDVLALDFDYFNFTATVINPPQSGGVNLGVGTSQLEPYTDLDWDVYYDVYSI